MREFALALLIMLPPLLLIDFLLFGRTAKEVTIPQAIAWSIGWVCAALVFAGLVWHLAGPTDAGLFLSVYVLEKSLSVDNLLVFAALLAAHSVDVELRQRVLTWGIAMALVLRGVALAGGYTLLQITPLAHLAFGALLVGAGIGMMRRQVLDSATHVEPVPQPAVGRSTLRITLGLLGAIALADLLFALDSLPAAFSITTNPAIVFSANVFALLGLRALYFVLEHVLRRMRYVQAALGIALVLVGIRMTLGDKLDVPTWAPAAVTALLVTVGMLASMWNDSSSAEVETFADLPQSQGG